MIKKLILLAILLTIIFVISEISNREFNTSFVASITEPKGSTTELPDVKESTSSETEQNRTTTDETSVVIVAREGTYSSIDESETKIDEAERIYADFQKLERIIRRYLSGGHRISMLNFGTLKQFGYLGAEDLYLEDGYEIGFTPKNDGFTIFVKPKTLLNAEVTAKLKDKANIQLDTFSNPRYEFWIKAYRTP
ncbi:hypothetical protein [Fervidobacterium thailandense]|uniref:Uncharacterized protein n=1 Tax=Fervidobacterium thailandense TaxID=1008305 RepID=A0A1E3G2A6_9BACT|nr:hypothetical protein [Fervidobacterium thailandense]ODN30379.1 hypothetical protein A4H02_05885 [Fervidobacterium thailandense]